VSGGLVDDEAIYAGCVRDLVGFATSLVGPDDAADVVSEAVISVMSAAVWTDAANKRSLLFRSVFFTSRTWHRSTRRRRARQVHAVGIDSVELRPQESSEVTDALAALSDQQRAVIFLTYWSDLDPVAIAEMLDTSEGSVRKQLARARSKLREVLR
jgi:RNA polymerase sigma-70 factor (ECF subfamily)